jgi:hypothetical protein
MAERALYGNLTEPAFPFERMRDRLSWLPNYLAEDTSDSAYDLDALLNTILVFTRARTATMQNLFSWSKVRRLVKLLNAAADSVGASHHRVELVRRGPYFFVTCSHSPRFNWAVHLTDRDVGRNLDMFAPGHCTTDQRYTKRFVYLVEISSMKVVTSEVVLLEYLNADDSLGEFHRFNQTRESLFNSTMEALGLVHRFKCIVHTREALDYVASVMESHAPPTLTWWQNHCFYVNGWLNPDVITNANLAFCGFRTKHEIYWPLIRRVFQFSTKYNRYEYLYTSSETGAGYWKSIEEIFGRIKTTCEQDISAEDFDRFCEEVENRLLELATLADSPSKSPNEDPSRCVSIYPSGPRQHGSFFKWFQRVRSNLSSTFDIGYMFICERWKLEERLVRVNEVGYPSSGDDPAFVWSRRH